MRFRVVVALVFALAASACSCRKPQQEEADSRTPIEHVEHTIQGWHVEVKTLGTVRTHFAVRFKLTIRPPAQERLRERVELRLKSPTLGRPHYDDSISISPDSFFHDPNINMYWLEIQDVFGSNWRSGRSTSLETGIHDIQVTVKANDVTVDMPLLRIAVHP